MTAARTQRAASWQRLSGAARLALAGVLGVFSFAAVAAPNACPPSAIASLEKPNTGQRSGVDRGLLWRIEQNGRSSWLYGTIHIGRAEWVRPGPTVQKALAQADVFAMEIDTRDKATIAALTQPADPELVTRLLAGERGRRLERQKEAACLPAGALAGMQPILQATTLGGLVGRFDGLYPEYGVDETLAIAARNGRKPVIALETAALQLKMLSGESEAEEAEQVDAALDELESGTLRGQLKEMAEVWARSDAAKLERYPEWCNCLNTPAEQRLMKRLLDDRNPALADGIAQLHASGKSVFAAVGALHMVGPQGLPTLLAARGFTVTPVLTEVQASPAALPMPPLQPAERTRAVKGKGKASKSAAASKGGKGGKAAPAASKAGKGAAKSSSGAAKGAKASSKSSAAPKAGGSKPAAKGKARG